MVAGPTYQCRDRRQRRALRECGELVEAADGDERPSGIEPGTRQRVDDVKRRHFNTSFFGLLYQRPTR
jgi:hypothetical protein